MTEEQLAFYLLGFFEMSDTDVFTKTQLAKINKAVASVKAHHNSMLANHIEAVSDSPKAVYKIVKVYLEVDRPAKIEKQNIMKKTYQNIQSAWNGLVQTAFEDDR